MRLRTVGGVAGILLLTATASAVVPRPVVTQRVVADHLTAMPAANVGAKPLRAFSAVRFNQRLSASWSHFAQLAGGTWRAAWDQATGVPSRIWGSGIAIPGANASPVIAEVAARQWLAQHLSLLAPGAGIADFELVSNHSDGDQRSVGFVQKAKGRLVVGGQISFRFKRDRLFVIASEALPHVTLDPIALKRQPMKPQALLARATTNLRTELALPNAAVKVMGEEVVLPLVADDAVLGYRVAVPHEIDGGFEGRYLAYVDPANGAVLAVHQQNRYADGTLFYRSVDRFPGGGRFDKPANRARVRVGGADQTTSSGGAVSWSPDVTQTIDTAVTGDFVAITNKQEGGALATAQVSILPNGVAVWDAQAVIEDDAQLIAFIATNTVKDYIRTNLDSEMPTINDPMPVNVNLPQNCNAFWDGKAINFFVQNDTCENTGRVEDVVYHEFGHHLHGNEIIQGVGRFDGSMSEGAADFMATLITNDSAMGRGFNLNNAPLRELNPVNSEAIFPQDVGEIHKTGIIYGGAFWDLREALFAALGAGPGRALLHKLFLATLRRAVSIQTSLIEVLAADDDDGDLSNGTPNECLIRNAFGRHGLRTATGALLAPSAIDLNALATVVRLDMEDLSQNCTGDQIDHVDLDWRPGFTPLPHAGSVLMTRVNQGRFFGQLPLAIDGTVVFKAKVTFVDGSTLTLADNFADPYYMVYQGSTVPLYCIDFDKTNPFADGWTTGTSDGTKSPWEYGVPNGEGPTDPPFAFTGTKILAQGLNADYPGKQFSFMKMPPIDVRQYSDVRLQYRRWLAVEDSEFDKARITVADRQAFVNFTANAGQRSTTHHIDREWRFQDIGVSGYTFGHTIEIAWDMQSDDGLNLGGWALDDVCVVANRHSICGDGVKNVFEQCDDGPDNADEPNKCRTWCLHPVCGDNIVDDGEECDEGLGGTETCSAACKIIPAVDTGCCSSAGRGGGGAFLLGGLVGLIVFRRRRSPPRGFARLAARWHR